jgi:hypothetical protein
MLKACGAVRPMSGQQLRLIFCQRFNCPTSEFEARAFGKCLYWQARWLAPLVRSLKPNFFAEDFKFIRHLGEATSLREAEVSLISYRDVSLSRASFWRVGLKVRVSSRKAFRLVRELLAAEGESVVEAR